MRFTDGHFAGIPFGQYRVNDHPDHASQFNKRKGKTKRKRSTIIPWSYFWYTNMYHKISFELTLTQTLIWNPSQSGSYPSPNLNVILMAVNRNRSDNLGYRISEIFFNRKI